MAGHRHAGKVDLRVLGCSRGNSGRLQGCGGTAASADGKRVEGIEPSSLAWKAIALPLSYTRVERPPDRADLSRSTLAWHLGAWHTGQWGVQDSNLRRNNPSDLQSDPFDRSGNSPRALPPWGSGSDGCFGCVPVGCPWWVPAGSLRVVDVTSGCESDCAGGFRNCVTSGIAVLSCVLKSGRHWRLAGHAELAAGVEPATC